MIGLLCVHVGPHMIDSYIHRQGGPIFFALSLGPLVPVAGVVEAPGAMNVFFQLPFVAGMFSLLLAGVSVVRRKPSPATWCFFAGMTALGIDSVLTGLSLRATRLAEVIRWMTAALVVKCFIPVIWLGFSLTYSRSDYREFLNRWRVALVLVGLLPVGLLLVFRDQLFQVVPAGAPGTRARLQFGPMTQLLNAILLVALVLILMNLEQTFRAAVGTMRWRIKYVVLALVVIFGARLYVRSQAILFSAPDIALWASSPAALLIGCLFLTLAYARTGWREIDVHPSSAVLRSSLTVLIVGGYLFVVGVLALVVQRFGGAESLSAAGVRRAARDGRPGGVAAVGPRPAARASTSSAAISGRRSTIRSGSGRCSRSGWPASPIRLRLCAVVREVDLRDVRRAVGHRVAASTRRQGSS